MHDEFLYAVDRTVLYRARVNIVPIKINPVWISSVMASIDPIRIDDWNQIENEFLQKEPCYVRIAYQTFQNTVHHVA